MQARRQCGKATWLRDVRRIKGRVHTIADVRLLIRNWHGRRGLGAFALIRLLLLALLLLLLFAGGVLRKMGMVRRMCRFAHGCKLALLPKDWGYRGGRFCPGNDFVMRQGDE